MLIKWLDSILKYRYILSLVVFAVCVSLNLHGSSINNWANMGVRETASGTQIETQNEYQTSTGGLDTLKVTLQKWISIPPRPDGTIVGVARMIRSDEWLVQTPFYISQSSTGNELINDSYALSGQNMIVAYNAPVKHISVIGKPFNWGFLFLGSEKGLSWYWSFKMLALLLLAFEFAMILTQKNKLLSLLGSIWITFTPTVQWWFMQHLGDVVFFSLLILVSIYHYFHAKAIKEKLVFASLLGMGMIGFTLVIYPAFQVVFAYLLLAFFTIEFSKALKNKTIHREDWIIMSVTFLLSSSIIAFSIWESLDAIRLTLNTVYPGSRTSVGGEINLFQFSEVIVNFLLPFKIPQFSNQVELSSALHFAPFCILCMPFYFSKKATKEHLFGLFLMAYYCLLCYYAVVGVPEFLSKLTLFSFVTGSRAWQASSVIGVFVSLWVIAYIWKEKRVYQPIPVIVSIMIGLIYALVLLGNPVYANYLGKVTTIFLIVFFLLIFLLFMYRKKIAVILMLGAILLSGATVNPLVYGLRGLEEKSLSIAIKEIVQRDSDAQWIAENSYLYQYPQMFGAKSLDGVRFYPDIALMNKIDPTNQFEENWNRYAHVHYTLTDAETSMSNPAPDNLHIHLNSSKLSDLQVNYIISNRDLITLFGDGFERVYGPDLDGNSIYYYKDN